MPFFLMLLYVSSVRLQNEALGNLILKELFSLVNHSTHNIS